MKIKMINFIKTKRKKKYLQRSKTKVTYLLY